MNNCYGSFYFKEVSVITAECKGVCSVQRSDSAHILMSCYLCNRSRASEQHPGPGLHCIHSGSNQTFDWFCCEFLSKPYSFVFLLNDSVSSSESSVSGTLTIE